MKGTRDERDRGLAKQGSMKNFDAGFLDLMENGLYPRQIDLHIARRKPLFGRSDSSKSNVPKEDPLMRPRRMSII